MSERGEYKQPDEETKRYIVETILKDKISHHAAAKRWSYPRSTIVGWIHRYQEAEYAEMDQKKTPGPATEPSGTPLASSTKIFKKMGHPTLMTDEEELILKALLVRRAECYMGAERPVVIQMANSIIMHRKEIDLRDTPRVGNKWCTGYFKRFPELAFRIPQPLDKDRLQSTSEDVVLPHVECLRNVMGKYELWQHPADIWNVDETSLVLGTRNRTRVVALRGARRVYQVASSDTRHVSVIFAVNAAGRYSPPCFVLPFQRRPREFYQSLQQVREPSWSTVCTGSGFITSEAFFQWMEEFVRHLDQHVRRGDASRPQLLIMDQFSGHDSVDIREYALQHHILLYALPPHTTHILQPVDVGLFGPMKKAYRCAERNLTYQRLLEREVKRRAGEEQHQDEEEERAICSRKTPPERFTGIYDIPLIFKPAVLKSFTPANIEAAFRSTGIYPFNAEKALRYVEKDQEKEESKDDEMLTDEEQTARDVVLTKPRKNQKRSNMPQCGLMTLEDYLENDEARHESKARRAKNVEERTKKAQDKMKAAAQGLTLRQRVVAARERRQEEIKRKAESRKRRRATNTLADKRQRRKNESFESEVEPPIKRRRFSTTETSYSVASRHKVPRQSNSGLKYRGKRPKRAARSHVWPPNSDAEE